MKNIHLIPTDKPSRLFYNVGGALLFTNYENYNGVHIYITSDEEIKDGDWIKWGEAIYKANKKYMPPFKKIILTTDQDLIKDGVQAIDDEFLEWFVKNPSCEEVEVVGDDCYYEIIIPKEEPKQIKCYCGHTTYCDCSPLEEPKQETLEEPTMIDDWLNEYGDPEIYKKVEKQLELEEAAEKVYPNEGFKDEIWADLGEVFREKFIEGAKWQAERSYSEEEVKHIVSEALQSALVGYDLEQWFTQFRKKRNESKSKT